MPFGRRLLASSVLSGFQVFVRGGRASWYPSRQGPVDAASWVKTESLPDEQELAESSQDGEYCSNGVDRSRYCRGGTEQHELSYCQITPPPRVGTVEFSPPRLATGHQKPSVSRAKSRSVCKRTRSLTGRPLCGICATSPQLLLRKSCLLFQLDSRPFVFYEKNVMCNTCKEQILKIIKNVWLADVLIY